MKKFKIWVWLMVFVIVSENVLACTGARGAGMGYAVETCSTDANAVYFAPELLPYIGRQISFTRTFDTEADSLKYDNVLSYALPFGTKYGLGVQMMDGSSGRPTAKLDMKWVKVAAGMKVIDEPNFDFSVGAGLDWIESRRIKNSEDNLDVYFGTAASWHSVLRDDDRFRLGVLYQTAGNNLRPSSSYSFRDGFGYTTLALTVYGAFHFEQLTGGVEKTFEFHGGKFALRGGVKRKFWHSSDEKPYSYTHPILGLGVQYGRVKIDYAAYFNEFGIASLLELGLMF